MADPDMEWERIEYPLKCGARVERIKVIIKERADDEGNRLGFIGETPDDDYWEDDPDESKSDYYEYDFDKFI